MCLQVAAIRFDGTDRIEAELRLMCSSEAGSASLSSRLPATGDEEPLVAQLLGRARALHVPFQRRVVEVLHLPVQLCTRCLNHPKLQPLSRHTDSPSRPRRLSAP